MTLITQNQNITSDDIVTDDWEFVGEIDVPPRSNPELIDSLEIGMYEQTEQPPALVFEVYPNPDIPKDVFVANLQRVDERDTYRLVYFFGNYGGQTYHVRVWRHVSP